MRNVQKRWWRHRLKEVFWGIVVGVVGLVSLATFSILLQNLTALRLVNAQTDGCPYESTQVRVQLNETDSWDRQEMIRLGQSINIGGFHNGTGRFAGDPVNTYSPNTANIDFVITSSGGTSITLSPPYSVRFAPTVAGTYTIVGKTRRDLVNVGAGYYTSASCTDSATVVVSTPAVQQATTSPLFALLRGSNQVPPLSSSATGTAVGSYNDGTNLLNIELFVIGISKANLTGSHIHLGAVGVNGDILLDLGPPSAWEEVLGVLHRSISDSAFPENQEAALLSGTTYVNIHSNAYPDGEIRGQLLVGILPSPSPSPTPSASVSPSPVASPSPTTSPSPTPLSSASPSPVATPSPTPTASPSPSATPATTQVRLCKYADDNANGSRDNGENVLSWKFTLFISGEASRVVESHWWNILTQGCAIETIPVDRTVTVEEEQRSGWRQTALYIDGIRQSTNSFTYTSRRDEERVMWFLDTFTPTGGAPVATPTPSPVTTNTQPECVGLSANPTFGGATLTVSFIGKGRDLDGIIRQMEFNLGEGASQIVDVSGETNRETIATVSHLYRQAGTFNASLRVKDNSGQGNEWSATPETCKVTINVQGTVLGSTTTTTVTQLPKAGVNEGMTLGYLTSGIVGWGLMKLAKKLRELS